MSPRGLLSCAAAEGAAFAFAAEAAVPPGGRSRRQHGDRHDETRQPQKRGRLTWRIWGWRALRKCISRDRGAKLGQARNTGREPTWALSRQSWQSRTMSCELRRVGSVFGRSGGGSRSEPCISAKRGGTRAKATGIFRPAPALFLSRTFASSPRPRELVASRGARSRTGSSRLPPPRRPLCFAPPQRRPRGGRGRLGPPGRRWRRRRRRNPGRGAR